MKRMKKEENSVEFNNLRRILKIYLLIFVCICKGLNVYMNTGSLCGVYRGQKRVLDPSEL